MACPHCGYAAPDDASECESCGYLIRPPAAPPLKRRNLVVVACIVVLVLFGFVMAARVFRERSESAVNFFGERSYLDYGARRLNLAPGGFADFGLRITDATPLCRVHGSAATTASGVSIMILDSLNYQRLTTSGPLTPVATRQIAGPTDFSLQAEGAGQYFIVIRQQSGQDTVPVALERLQAMCYESW